MYTYPSTMYTYPSTMYITCIHTYTLTDSSAVRTAVKLYFLSLTSSSLLSFSSSSVTKPGNNRTHT